MSGIFKYSNIQIFMLSQSKVATRTEEDHPHLLTDVDVTGVDAVSEKVFGAAVTAAQVAVVEQLPAQTHTDAQTP